MPSNPSPPRPLYKPGTEFSQRAIPVTRQPRRAWFRVHRSGSPAIEFRRLSHHRFSHPASPFPLLYVAASPQTCLWEYFGDNLFEGQRAICSGKWNGCSLSRIIVPQLNVRAASLERTREAMGLDKASLMAADLSIPQAWGLAVQQHPAAFEAIKYSSCFLDLPCLALFDRGGTAAKLQAELLGALSDLDAAVDWLDERNASLV